MILIFSILQVMFGLQRNFYITNIRNDSILKITEVNSISSCYFQCWDFEFQCCAVGFLSSEINNKKRDKVKCYMIKCDEMRNGGDVQLEVLVSYT